MMYGGRNSTGERRYGEVRCATLGRAHVTLGRFPWP